MTSVRRAASRPVRLVALTFVPALVAALIMLAPSAAHAGPKQRKDFTRTQVAVLAEVMHHGATETKLPKRLNRKILAKRYGHTLPRTLRIAKYKRLKGGTAFRVCLRHKNGGWATWHSGKGKIRAKGKGKRCRF